jgi:ribosomal protein S18 acetylase RimI-like enzyme
MVNDMEPSPDSKQADPQRIVLRSEAIADEPFLAGVYASTREDELKLTNWDAPTRAAFLDMQFKAMRKGYGEMFPRAQFDIIEHNGGRVGRLVVNRAPEEIRVVDIALLPEHCGRGIGAHLMRQIMEEASRAKKPVRLCVLNGTRAIRFYQRLGFSLNAETGIYQEMEWRPAV